MIKRQRGRGARGIDESVIKMLSLEIQVGQEEKQWKERADALGEHREVHSGEV